MINYMTTPMKDCPGLVGVLGPLAKVPIGKLDRDEVRRAVLGAPPPLTLENAIDMLVNGNWRQAPAHHPDVIAEWRAWYVGAAALLNKTVEAQRKKDRAWRQADAHHPNVAVEWNAWWFTNATPRSKHAKRRGRA